MKNQLFNPMTLGSAVVLSAALAGSAVAGENPFAAEQLKSGYEVAMAGEGKCGEGKCGADTKKTDAACGEDKKAEGKCGEEKKTDAKCGEGKCGGEEKKTDAKCGEGKCGG